MTNYGLLEMYFICFIFIMHLPPSALAKKITVSFTVIETEVFRIERHFHFNPFIEKLSDMRSSCHALLIPP